MSKQIIEHTPLGMFFKNPVKTSSVELYSKQTIILKKEIAEDRFVFGEIPLLPEFGTEKFDDIEKVFSGQTYFSTKFPALSFGLTQISVAENFQIDETLNPQKNEFELQAFLGFEDFNFELQKAEEFKQHNFSAVKIKVGNDYKKEIERISELIKILGNEIKLRLDPNGCWELSDYLNYQNELQKFNIEYIEQPVNGLAELLKFAEKSDLPVASDESVKNLAQLQEIIINKKIKNIVLKPVLCGGYFKSREMIMIAEGNGISVTLSSAYETNLGKEILALLASQMNSNTAHGFGNGNWFKNDVDTEFFKFEKNKCIVFPAGFNKFKL